MKRIKWLIFFISIIAAFSIILDQSLTTYERFLVALIPFFLWFMCYIFITKETSIGCGILHDDDSFFLTVCYLPYFIFV